MMKKLKSVFAGIFVVYAVFSPLSSLAATKLTIAAWLPFWKKQTGAQEFALQMDKLQEVSLFSYEIRTDGTLIDRLKVNEGFWPGYLDALKDGGVKSIPTIALLDGDAVHALLSNKKLRDSHIKNIVNLVSAQKFDGIDIDYEDKWAKTRVYFNTFIKDLSAKLHAKKKILSCTIEGRTPLSDRFSKPPATMEYANDYPVLGKYCDEIRIMAYDQGSIDLKLDAAKGSSDFYMPVADPNWVEKVIKETIKSINRKKIMIGIPTYGYEYEVSWTNGITTYKRLRSHTFTTAMDTAERVGAVPHRNNAGEMSFVYASTTPISVSKNLTYAIVSTTAPAALSTAPNTVTRYVSFTDASAIADKLKLAKKYGLKGAALFKTDGETDPALWDILAKNR